MLLLCLSLQAELTVACWRADREVRTVVCRWEISTAWIRGAEGGATRRLSWPDWERLIIYVSYMCSSAWCVIAWCEFSTHLVDYLSEWKWFTYLFFLNILSKNRIWQIFFFFLIISLKTTDSERVFPDLPLFYFSSHAFQHRHLAIYQTSRWNQYFFFFFYSVFKNLLKQFTWQMRKLLSRSF